MITIFHVSVAAFTMEPEHFFTCFQQISVSGITVSSIIITNVYVAEMQNSVQETGYFIPSSSGEFNATVDVALRSTRILLGEGGGGEGGTGWGHLGIEMFFVAGVVQKLG